MDSPSDLNKNTYFEFCELIKSKGGAAKTGGSRIKEIKKVIARILTLENAAAKNKTAAGESKLLKENLREQEVRGGKNISKGKS